MILNSISKINKLKNDLRNNDLQSSIYCLSQIDSDKDIEVFREHKLLLIPNDKEELFQAYINASQRILSEKEADFQINYIALVRSYFSSTNTIKEKLKEMIAPFLKQGIRLFLISLNHCFEKQMKFLHKHLVDGISKKINKENLEGSSAISEFGYHDLIGMSNDILFAMTYLINLYCSLMNKNNKNDVELHLNFDSESEFDELNGAIYLASNINCLQYSLDKVSFGEWVVENYQNEAGISHFSFTLVDEKLEMSRDLALRRIASQKIIGSKRIKYFSKLLESYSISVFDFAYEYCLDKSNTILYRNKEIYNDIKKQILATLNELEVEDEMILAMNMNNVPIVSSYLSAIALNVFVQTSDNFKSKSKKKLEIYYSPIIPIKEISSIVDQTKIINKSAKNNISDYISLLPVYQYLDIFSSPFIKDKSGEVVSIDFLAKSNWPEWVRARLMKGGRTADQIGKTWEKYVVNILKDNQWNKIKHSVKLRKDGRLLTDVDIIAKRDNLLLLIQLKVYYGSGINPYEQWKLRKKLINATEQIKIGERTIQSDKSILKQCFSDKELKEINTIKSLVMTNSHLFNGFKFNNIPVMSIGSLMQMINGANVKFVTQLGDVIGEKKYFKNTTISNKEFIDFIEKPLDWRIGNTEYSVLRHKEMIGDLILNIPILNYSDSFNLRTSLSEKEYDQ